MKASIMKIINAVFCASWKNTFPWKWVLGSTAAPALEWFSCPASSLRSNEWACYNKLLFQRDRRDKEERCSAFNTPCLSVRFRYYFSIINTQLISIWLNLELCHDIMYFFCSLFPFYFFKNCPLCPHPHMAIILTVTKLQLWFWVCRVWFFFQTAMSCIWKCSHNNLSFSYSLAVPNFISHHIFLRKVGTVLVFKWINKLWLRHMIS